MQTNAPLDDVVENDELPITELATTDLETTDVAVLEDGDEPEASLEGVEEEEEEDLEEEEGRRWFVIHTYSGYENKVETNLKHRIASMGVDDKIYDVVIPTEEQVE